MAAAASSTSVDDPFSRVSDPGGSDLDLPWKNLPLIFLSLSLSLNFNEFSSAYGTIWSIFPFNPLIISH